MNSPSLAAMVMIDWPAVTAWPGNLLMAMMVPEMGALMSWRRTRCSSSERRASRLLWSMRRVNSFWTGGVMWVDSGGRVWGVGGGAMGGVLAAAMGLAGGAVVGRRPRWVLSS